MVLSKNMYNAQELFLFLQLPFMRKNPFFFVICWMYIINVINAIIDKNHSSQRKKKK
jgi:hypothetical protein